MFAAQNASAAFVLGLPGDTDPDVDVFGVTAVPPVVWPADGPTDSQIAEALGLDPASLLGDLQFKFEYKNDLVETEGTLSASYLGTFDPIDGSGTALIRYVEGAAYSSQPTALLAKDGSHGHWVFDISGWDGMEDILIKDLWPNQGDFSHVKFYGTEDDVPSIIPVPEPSTYVAGILLGLPFVVGMARRMLRQSAV